MKAYSKEPTLPHGSPNSLLATKQASRSNSHPKGLSLSQLILNLPGHTISPFVAATWSRQVVNRFPQDQRHRGIYCQCPVGANSFKAQRASIGVRDASVGEKSFNLSAYRC